MDAPPATDDDRGWIEWALRLAQTPAGELREGTIVDAIEDLPKFLEPATFGPGHSPGRSPVLKITREDVSAAALMLHEIFDALVYRHMEFHEAKLYHTKPADKKEVSLLLTARPDHEGYSVVTFIPGDFKSALFWALRDRLRPFHPTQLRECPGCGVWFLAIRKPKDTTRKFHSVGCGAAYNLRRFRAGQSTPRKPGKKKAAKKQTAKR